MQGGSSGRAVTVSALFRRFKLAALILVAFALMLIGKADAVLVERVSTTLTDAVAPMMRVLSRPASAISQGLEEVRELARLREENTLLRAENARLKHWQMVARNLDAENVQLRNLLNLPAPPQQSFVTARVVGDTGGAFAHSFLVAVGRQQGVRKGSAVMTADGLIGRVAQVGFRSARILLITDINSRLPVQVESTRVRALLVGDNTEEPVLSFIGNNAVIRPGDRIVTSGHGRAFPPGLPVGVVTSVDAENGTVRMQPFVDRNRVEYVRIVDWGLDGILDVNRPAPFIGANPPAVPAPVSEAPAARASPPAVDDIPVGPAAEDIAAQPAEP